VEEGNGNREGKELLEVDCIVVDGTREGEPRRWVEEGEDGSEGL